MSHQWLKQGLVLQEGDQRRQLWMIIRYLWGSGALLVSLLDATEIFSSIPGEPLPRTISFHPCLLWCNIQVHSSGESRAEGHEISQDFPFSSLWFPFGYAQLWCWIRWLSRVVTLTLTLPWIVILPWQDVAIALMVSTIINNVVSVNRGTFHFRTGSKLQMRGDDVSSTSTDTAFDFWAKWFWYPCIFRNSDSWRTSTYKLHRYIWFAWLHRYMKHIIFLVLNLGNLWSCLTGSSAAPDSLETGSDTSGLTPCRKNIYFLLTYARIIDSTSVETGDMDINEWMNLNQKVNTCVLPGSCLTGSSTAPGSWETVSDTSGLTPCRKIYFSLNMIKSRKLADASSWQDHWQHQAA